MGEAKKAEKSGGVRCPIDDVGRDISCAVDRIFNAADNYVDRSFDGIRSNVSQCGAGATAMDAYSCYPDVRNAMKRCPGVQT